MNPVAYPFVKIKTTLAHLLSPRASPAGHHAYITFLVSSGWVSAPSGTLTHAIGFLWDWWASPMPGCLFVVSSVLQFHWLLWAFYSPPTPPPIIFVQSPLNRLPHIQVNLSSQFLLSIIFLLVTFVKYYMPGLVLGTLHFFSPYNSSQKEVFYLFPFGQA